MENTKKIAYYITVDQNGNELSRKVRSKGRPPKGVEKAPRADGNFYIVEQANPDHALTVQTVETVTSNGGEGLVDSFATNIETVAWVGNVIPAEFVGTPEQELAEITDLAVAAA